MQKNIVFGVNQALAEQGQRREEKTTVSAAGSETLATIKEELESLKRENAQFAEAMEEVQAQNKDLKEKLEQMLAQGNKKKTKKKTTKGSKTA